MVEEDKLILVGRIAGIYGIKGWVKIVSYTSPLHRILSYSPWYLRYQDELKSIEITDSSYSGKKLYAAMAGVEDRDIAREYIGSEIFIYRKQLDDLPEGQYYLNDLLNLQVVNTENRILGTIQDIYETGANDVLVVEGEERYLIPLVWEHYLLEVDIEKGIIRVDWD